MPITSSFSRTSGRNSQSLNSPSLKSSAQSASAGSVHSNTPTKSPTSAGAKSTTISKPAKPMSTLTPKTASTATINKSKQPTPPLSNTKKTDTPKATPLKQSVSTSKIEVKVVQNASQSLVKAKSQTSVDSGSAPKWRTNNVTQKRIEQARLLKEKQAKANQPCFANMPEEVLMLIFHKLPVNAVLACACVNQHWNIVASDPLLWRTLYMKRWPAKEEGMWRELYFKRHRAGVMANVNQLKKRKSPVSLMPNICEILSGYSVTWLVTAVTQNKTFEIASEPEVVGQPGSLSVRFPSVSEEAPRFSFVKAYELFACMEPLPVYRSVTARTQAVWHGRRVLVGRYEVPGVGWGGKLHTHTIAEDGALTVLKLGEAILGVWLESWQLGGEAAFLQFTLSYHTLLERVFNASRDKLYTAPAHKPVFDDIDSEYGLHDYTVYLGLRTHKACKYERRFEKLFCRKEDIRQERTPKARFADLVLVRDREGHEEIRGPLALPYTTAAFKRSLKDVVVLDLVVYDEHGSVMHALCTPVCFKTVNRNADFCHSQQEFKQLSYQVPDTLGVTMNCVSKPDSSNYTVLDLSVSLDVKFINSWFGTNYEA
eukprot:Colp12_sorted_trinity150504_noHs@20297